VKNIIFVVAFVTTAVWGYQSKIGNAKTGIDAYSEVRFKLSNELSSREIELVVFVKRDTRDSCEEMKSWVSEAIIQCTDLADCQVIKNTCAFDIPNRYMKMFKGQPARTTYLRATNESLDRSLVLLFWGLNDAEADQWCSDLYDKITVNNKRRISAQCL